MNYLFDTNIVAFFYDRTSSNHLTVYKKFSSLKDEDNLYVSILTLYELQYSLSNANKQKKLLLQQLVDKTRTKFEILSLNYQGAQIYGELKSRLKEARNMTRENVKKHNIDVMLASTAIEEGCILVSNDRIFEDIGRINDKFIFQNWLS